MWLFLFCFPLCCVQVSPLPSNMSESVCSLKFAQRVRSVELSSSSSSSRRHENSSTSSSPTHDSVEVTETFGVNYVTLHKDISSYVSQFSYFYSVFLLYSWFKFGFICKMKKCLNKMPIKEFWLNVILASMFYSFEMILNCKMLTLTNKKHTKIWNIV